MLEKIIIFIIFLGPLIFFHELGHFIFAKLFGVRVDVFSLGFGPKILKFKKGVTEYAISIIPLGGYVKMYGEDLMNRESVPQDLKAISFAHKSKWARFWIIFGGPLLNFIFAYFIFAFLSMTGEKVPQMRFGVIDDSAKIYQLGVRSGDVLKSINGKEVFGPTDILLGDKEIITDLGVDRGGSIEQIKMQIEAKTFFEEFSKASQPMRRPVLIDTTGELWVISTSAENISWDSSIDQLAGNGFVGSLYILKILEKKDELEKSLIDRNSLKTISVNSKNKKEFYGQLKQEGYVCVDLMVKNVRMGMTADKAGIKMGDIIDSIDGQSLLGFEDLKNIIQKIEKESITSVVWRNGKSLNFTLTPEIQSLNGVETKLIGIESAVEYVPVQYVNTRPLPIHLAAVAGLTRTWDASVNMLVGFKNLFTGATSLKNIGGPVAIGQVAADSFKTSLSYFFQIMALISINLGIINLLPIPVLDGGHIMFLIGEAINKGPFSQRKMEIAQQIGLSFLLLLMVAALFNDFSRLF